MIQLLTSYSAKLADLLAKFTNNGADLDVMRMAATRTIETLGSMTWFHAVLCSKLDNRLAVGFQRKNVLQYSIDRAYTGYSRLMHMNADNYIKQLIFLFSNARLGG